MILDKKDQINLIREIAAELNLTMSDVEAKKCLDSIQQIKSKNFDYVKFIFETKDKNLSKKIDSEKENQQTYLLRLL